MVNICRAVTMLFPRKSGNGEGENWDSGGAQWNADPPSESVELTVIWEQPRRAESEAKWQYRDTKAPPTFKSSKSLVGRSRFLRVHYALVSRRAHFHRRTMVA